MEPIVITGMGGVSPIGVGNEAMDHCLRESKHGYKDISGLSDSEKYPLTNGAKIEDFNPDDYLSFPPEAKYRSTVRTKRLDTISQYALVAAKLAAQQAGMLGENDLLADDMFADTAVVLGVALYGVESFSRLYNDFQGGKKVSPFAVPMYMTNAPASVVSTYFNFQGAPFTVCTACASSLTSLIRACDILQLDRPNGPKFVLAGGAEAALTDFVSASFMAARAMSPDGISRPFDAHRNGFGPGEGAGVFVLERKRDALARGAKPLVEIIGFDERHDHYDAELAPNVNFTSPDIDGGQLADSIRAALAMGDFPLDQVSVYNAHGTGTEFNDLAEANALKKVFGEKIPEVIALKSFMAHSGGATAALEIIGGILGMQGGYLAGNPQWSEPDPAIGFTFSREAKPFEARAEVKTGMGFGGARAVVAYKKFEG